MPKKYYAFPIENYTGVLPLYEGCSCDQRNSKSDYGPRYEPRDVTITLQHSVDLEILKFKPHDHYLFIEISLHDNKPVFS
jgi:hypothetical protein